MKNVKSLKRSFLYFGVFFLAIGLNSCSDDDDGDIPVDPEPTASITVGADQTISQNTLMVDQVTASTDVWLVARQTDASGEILAQQLVTEGTTSDIELNLQGTTLNPGDTVYLTLYADDGDGTPDGLFEEGTDDTVIAGTAEAVAVTNPSFSIANPVVTNNSVTFDNVTVNDMGWIVLYDADPSLDTANIVGQTMVTGSEDNVVVTFNENFTYTQGDDLFARLHVEDPADSQFTFMTDPTQDVPEIFGFEADNTIWEMLVIE